MPRSYQVTPGILRRRRATQPKKVRPTADSMEKSQPAADREPSRPHRTPPPDTPRVSLTWKATANLPRPQVRYLDVAQQLRPLVPIGNAPCHEQEIAVNDGHAMLAVCKSQDG